MKLSEEELPEILSSTQLKRKLIYNAVPLELAEDTCVVAGLNRSSPDVEEMETKASVERLQRLVPILPILTALSDTLAEVATAIQIDNLEEAVEGIPEEVKQTIALVSTQNMRSTIVSVLSVLVDLGLVKVA